MASSVFFKFKSSKEPMRITFDGTGISVFELKREIIAASGLGDGTDFDLHIYPEENDKAEYDDDTTIISRSSTVIARRVPASKPGAGRAARYVSGRPPVRAIKHSHNPVASKVTNSSASGAPQTEKEREEAFLMASEDAWEQQKEAMSHAKPVFRKKAQAPDHPPPQGYTCFRCDEPGHWIQACPTNNDPDFKPKSRVKRTTGIPRSFLKTLDKPLGEDDDMKGVMKNAQGEYVLVETDKKAWEKFQAKAQASAAQAETAAAANKEIQERGLECSIDQRMFVEPVKTPCCGKTYCHDCIENALAESDLVCPNCSTDGVLIDDLTADEEMVEKIRAYEAEKAKEKLKKATQAKEDTKAVPNPSSPNNNDVSVTPPAVEAAKPSERNGSGSEEHNQNSAPVSSSNFNTSLTATASAQGVTGGNGSDTDSSTTSRKRKAETDIDNDRKPAPPTAPKAMRQQQEKQQQQPSSTDLEQEFINSMNALKDMPFPMPLPATMGMSMPVPMNPMMATMGPGPMNGMNMTNMNNWTGGYNNNGYPNMYGGMPFGNMNMGNGMNPMAAMNGMGMNNGAGMAGAGNAGYGGWGGQNYAGNMNYDQNNMGNSSAAFPNQQRNNYSQQPYSNEDDAYFRKPVNPQRHQNRQRRQRPSDIHYVG